MNNFPNYFHYLQQKPNAIASVKGSDDYPGINGLVRFYQTQQGVLVVARFTGLPIEYDVCAKQIFAMHIHSGESCTGNATDSFADAQTHYNPNDCPHPYHAGDMPPVFNCNGNAFSMFLTDRFRVREIISKTLILHSGVDDFTSQPAGNAGTKIGCGVIKGLF